MSQNWLWSWISKLWAQSRCNYIYVAFLSNFISEPFRYSHLSTIRSIWCFRIFHIEIQRNDSSFSFIYSQNVLNPNFCLIRASCFSWAIANCVMAAMIRKRASRLNDFPVCVESGQNRSTHESFSICARRVLRAGTRQFEIHWFIQLLPQLKRLDEKPLLDLLDQQNLAVTLQSINTGFLCLDTTIERRWDHELSVVLTHYHCSVNNTVPDVSVSGKICH